jgi:hypothetical protein
VGQGGHRGHGALQVDLSPSAHQLHRLTAARASRARATLAGIPAEDPDPRADLPRRHGACSRSKAARRWRCCRASSRGRTTTW